MEEVLRSNDMVLISFAQSLLRDAGIECVVFDQHMSIMEGSIGILPRRVLVEAGMLDRARRVLADAGIESSA